MRTASSIFIDANGVSGYGLQSGLFNATVVLSAAGELQSISHANQPDIQRGTLINTDVYSNGEIVIGRWTAGTSAGMSPFTLNGYQGFHYAIALPAGTLPTFGGASYSMLAATSPTFGDGSSAPGSVQSASLSVVFGSSANIGFEAVVLMPEAAGTVRYGLTSMGGVANPATSGIFLFNDNGMNNPVGSFEGDFNATSNVAGAACGGATTCAGFATGNLAGASLTSATLSYNFDSATNDPHKVVSGTIAFGNKVANNTPPPTPTPTPAPTPMSTLAATNVFYRVGPGVSAGTGLDVVSSQQAVLYFDASSAIDHYTRGSGRNADVVSRGTSAAMDGGFATTGTSSVAWTRWAGGTPTDSSVSVPHTFAPLSVNQGIDLLAGTPLTNMPASGTGQYALLGATKPVIDDGSFAPGTFTGALGVNFASQTVGVDLSVAVGGQTYLLQSKGGATTPGTSTIGIVGQYASIPGQFGGNVSLPAGGICAAACMAGINGSLYGDGALQVGLYYNIRGESRQIFGVAAFGQSGGLTGVVPVPTTLSGQVFRTYGSVAAGGASPATIVATSDGKLDSFASGTGPATTRGSNTNNENGGVAGVIGWTRWAGGFTGGNSNVAIPIQGGGGFIWGTPATNVPTSGTGTYTLLGSTAPTANDASLTPGTVKAAAMAVSFASRMVGVTTTVGIGGADYALSSPGGTATPGMALDGSNGFLSSGAVVGGTCSGAACSARFQGFLAGPAASHAGVAYTFNNAPTNGVQINGTISFQKGP